MTSKQQILSLYKVLVREAKGFPSYNYRNYALRKIRDTFKMNKDLTEQHKILEQVELGFNNLEIIKRQVVVGSLYRTDKLVIENIIPKT